MPITSWLTVAGGIGFLLLCLYLLAKRQGREEQQLEDAQHANQVNDAQKDALANAPRSDDDITRRLRDAGF